MFDLTKFCDSESSRYKLSRPWKIEDGRIVATDGRVLVCVDSDRYDGELIDTSTARVPDVTTILADIDQVTDWTPLPEPDNCDKCNNTGEIVEGCRCFSGKCECPRCGKWHMCERCEGEGGTKRPCHDCLVQVGTRTIRREIVNRLREIGSVEFGTATDQPKDNVCVRFDGGVGVVSPTEKHED